MNKLMLAAVMVAVTLGSSAEVVKQVLASRSTTVEVYDVDDEGNWTKNRQFCSTSPKSARGVFCHRGIVYVGTTSGIDVDSGEVYRYDLSGKRLESLPGITVGSKDCGFVPYNMDVSPDGNYLFVGAGQGSSTKNKGKLYRYDLRKGLNGTWELFASCGTGCMRAVTIDGDGNVFWAPRGSFMYVGNCYQTENLPITSGFKYAGSGFICGIRYNPKDGYIYYESSKGDGNVGGKVQWDAANSKFINNTYVTDATTKLGWGDDLIIVNDKVYVSTINDPAGLYYADLEDATKCAYLLTGEFRAMDFIKYELQNPMEFESAYAAEETMGLEVSALWPQGGAIAGAENGVSGKCLYFRDATASAKFNNSRFLIPASDNFAFSMWVGMQSAASERLLFSNRIPAISNNELSLLVDENGKLGLKLNANATLVSSSANRIDDGAWHHVGMVRRSATSFELYEDGVCVGTLTTTDSAAIATESIRNWHIGCDAYESSGFLGAGAFVDRVCVGAAISEEDYNVFANEYAAYKDAEAPSAAPSAPEAAAIPADAGTRIAHAFACEQSFGSPTMAILDGTYYVGVSAGEAAHAKCESLRVYQSTDGGDTWSYHSTLNGSGATLFTTGGALCAVGMKADGSVSENATTACVWTYGAQGWAAVSARTLGEGQYETLSSQAAVMWNPRSKANMIYKSAVKRYGSGSLFNYCNVSFEFTVDGTTFTPGNVAVTTEILAPSFVTYDLCVDVLGGVSVYRQGSPYMASCGAHHFYPMVDRRNSSYASNPLSVERCSMVNTDWDGYNRNRTTDMFRGGSRPFGIAYNATEHRYYAVTVAVTNSAELAGVESQRDVNHALAVYTSQDLRAWYPSGVISDVGAEAVYGYNGAACIIDGDNLLVATVVGADDGAPGFNKLRSNYLAFRKVSNYVATHQPVTPATKERVYVVDREANYASYSYFKTADGELHPAGPFYAPTAYATAEDGKSYRLGASQNIICRGSRIYGSSVESGEKTDIKPARLYELSLKGGFRRIFVSPSTDYTLLNIDVSSDRTFAMAVATGGSNPGVYKVNFADNTWTKVVGNSDGHIGAARSVAIDSNGGIYVGTWDSTVICYYQPNAEGAYEYVKNVNQPSSGSAGYVTAMCLDEANDALYSTDLRGRIFKLTISTGKQECFSNSHIDGYHTFANEIAIDSVANKLYVTSRGGTTRAIDLTTREITCPFASIKISTAISHIPDITYLGENGIYLMLE